MKEKNCVMTSTWFNNNNHEMSNRDERAKMEIGM